MLCLKILIKTIPHYNSPNYSWQPPSRKLPLRMFEATVHPSTDLHPLSWLGSNNLTVALAFLTFGLWITRVPVWMDNTESALADMLLINRWSPQGPTCRPDLIYMIVPPQWKSRGEGLGKGHHHAKNVCTYHVLSICQDCTILGKHAITVLNDAMAN